jgi:hypothetical protein
MPRENTRAPFGHAAGSSGPGAVGNRSPKNREGAPGYDKLFEVVVQHGYYNRLDELRCSDFEVYPNARTEALMGRLGLLLLRSGSSFSVLYDTARADDLKGFLRSNTTSPTKDATPEPWTYLSFFLAPKNPRFFNLTQLPLDLHPLEQNFYFSNGRSDGAPGHLLSGDSKNPQAVSDKDLLPVKPARFPIEIPTGGKAVLRNSAGALKLKIDRTELDEARKRFEEARASSDRGVELEALGRTLRALFSSFFATPPEKGTFGAHVDLSRLYEGLYHLEVTDERGKPTRESLKFIYTLAAPAPLCFMHILLNQPNDEVTGTYPVDLGTGEIACCQYVVKFEARKTRWVYSIVPPPGMSFSGLTIESAGEGKAHEFAATPGGRSDGPTPLPNGASGYSFVSGERLPLLQRSDVWLQLRGRRSDIAGEERVLVDRLPVPSADQVLRQDHGDPKDIISDIYVYL